MPTTGAAAPAAVTSAHPSTWRDRTARIAAAIGAATRERRRPVVRTDATPLAEIARRSRQSYLAFLAEVLIPTPPAREPRRRRDRWVAQVPSTVDARCRSSRTPTPPSVPC